jgi:hypothetical protein
MLIAFNSEHHSKNQLTRMYAGLYSNTTLEKRRIEVHTFYHLLEELRTPIRHMDLVIRLKPIFGNNARNEFQNFDIDFFKIDRDLMHKMRKVEYQEKVMNSLVRLGTLDDLPHLCIVEYILKEYAYYIACYYSMFTNGTVDSVNETHRTYGQTLKVNKDLVRKDFCPENYLYILPTRIVPVPITKEF